jgi:hypothetical protein
VFSAYSRLSRGELDRGDKVFGAAGSSWKRVLVLRGEGDVDSTGGPQLVEAL